MGGGLLSVGFRRFCTDLAVRSTKCLSPDIQHPVRYTRGTYVVEKTRGVACVRSTSGIPVHQQRLNSRLCQLHGLSLRRSFRATSRLHGLRHVGAAASSNSAAMQRKVSHILLKADEAELLDEIEDRIAGGEDFKLLAAEYSNCGSSVKGGLVGWIEKGRTAPMFEEAVYEADIGELVRAETHFGLHLIKVEAERQQAGIVQMPVSELARILQDPEEVAKYQFIDVREPTEEALARIKQFQLFPLSKLREWGPSLKRNLDIAKPTIVMCHHGVRSQQAAQYLESEGFAQLSNVKGGIHEYSVNADQAVPVY